ncbi:hypothetical protein ACLI4Z_02475 [Natrialbaceae archaeon A-arb3/5]
MNRREVVRWGVTVGAVVTAGCLGGGANGINSETGAANTNSSNTSSSDAATTAPDSDEADDVELEPVESGPITGISTIDADSIDPTETAGLHRLIVENTGEETREFAIRIEHDGAVVLDGTDELPADTALELTVDEIGIYTTTVESGSAQSSATTTVSGDGCDSRTIISFGTSGGLSMYNENYC